MAINTELYLGPIFACGAGNSVIVRIAIFLLKFLIIRLPADFLQRQQNETVLLNIMEIQGPYFEKGEKD